MQIHQTSQLFYGKFPYRLNLERVFNLNDPEYHEGWTFHECQKWLRDNDIEHKICRTPEERPTQLVNCTIRARVFLRNQKDVDRFLALHGAYVTTLTKPDNDLHLDFIISNINGLARNRLFYDRYAYLIIFRREHLPYVDFNLASKEIQEMQSWLTMQFGHRNDGQVAYMFRDHYHRTRLYLSNEDDVMLVQMTWNEKILQVKKVVIWSK